MCPAVGNRRKEGWSASGSVGRVAEDMVGGGVAFLWAIGRLQARLPLVLSLAFQATPDTTEKPGSFAWQQSKPLA